MSQETLNTILASVIVPILVALTPFVCAYLNKLKEQVSARIKDDRLKKYLGIAEDAIETAVVDVMQTFVDSIKDTGQWTTEAREKAFYDAKRKSIAIMGMVAREVIREAYGDFDRWLDSSIEYYVNKNKTGTEAA